MNKKLFWKILVILVTLSLVICMGSIINLNAENKELVKENKELNELKILLEEEIISIREDNSKLKNDNLNQEIEYDFLNEKYEKEILPNPLSLALLKENGIDDYGVILKDLENKYDLISYDGVLGGTMRFIVDESKLINEKYVLAYFEDGHIAGYSLLKYKLQKANDIKWEVIDTYIIE